MSERQAETVALTKRRCRYCTNEYLAPRGERWHACRACAPTIMDALGEPVRNLRPPRAPFLLPPPDAA